MTIRWIIRPLFFLSFKWDMGHGSKSWIQFGAAMQLVGGETIPQMYGPNNFHSKNFYKHYYLS